MSSVDGRENSLGHDVGVDVVTVPCPLTSRDSASTVVDELQVRFTSDSEYESEESATVIDCGGVFTQTGIIEETHNVRVVGDTALQFADEQHFDVLRITDTDSEGHVTELVGEAWWSKSYCVSEGILGRCTEEVTVVDTSRITFSEF